MQSPNLTTVTQLLTSCQRMASVIAGLFMFTVTLKRNLNDSDRLESFQILVFAFSDAVNCFLSLKV